MIPRLILDVYAGLVGLVAGSYLNVVVHRLPLGQSTVLPRSRCPACGGAIRARDNVPVVSWLVLRGRCRDCGAAISVRYPLLELLTAALFVLCMERFGPSPAALAAAVFCGLMIALGAIDLEHMLLPDRLTLPGIVVGVAFQPFVGWAGRLAPGLGPGALGQVLAGVLGAAVGAGILLAAYLGWWLWRREEGLGLGDVKMLAMVGAFLGWRGVVVTLFLGATSGALFGLSLMALGRGGMRSKVPFGSFLAVGGLVALFAGAALIRLYVDLAFGPLPLSPGALGPP